MGDCAICRKYIPSSSDQMIVKDGPEYYLICLTHENSYELKKWIENRIRKEVEILLRKELDE